MSGRCDAQLPPLLRSRYNPRATLSIRIPNTKQGMIRSVVTVLLLVVCAASFAQPPSLEEVRRLMREGLLDDALTAVDARLAADGNDRHSRFLKGVVLAERGQSDAAIEVFKTLTRDHPELPEPYNNLAVLYAARGEYEAARDALLSAINTHSSYATAYENLGDIYAKMAGQAYTRALSLNTDNRGAQQKLALIDDLFLRGAAEPMSAAVARAARGPVPAAALLPTPVAEPVASVTPAAPAAAPVPATGRSAPAAAAARVPAAPTTAPRPAAPPAAVPATARPAAAVVTAAAPAGRAAPPAGQAPAAPGNAAAVVAAAVPVPSKAAPAEAHGGAIEAIQSWAAAWSAQDVPRYLSHYAAGRSPEENLSREEWESQRRVRLTKPAAIKVDVDNFQVRSAGPQRVEVIFVQRYRSDNYRDQVRKQLALERHDGNWKITSERTLATP
jgi:Tfp pilus assembly protein PilF